jgi:hypothetical protein
MLRQMLIAKMNHFFLQRNAKQEPKVLNNLVGELLVRPRSFL